MNILYITTVRMPTEKAHGVQIVKMCEAFARLGHSVELVVPRCTNELLDDPFTYYEVDRTFTITYLNARDFRPYNRISYWLHRLTFGFAALSLVKKRKPNLLYTRDELIAGFLSFQASPFVFEAHEGRWNVLTRRAVGAAAKLVVLTRGLAAYFTGRGVDASRIIVAPDAVDLNDFAHPQSRSAARQRLGLPEDKRIVLYIGLIDAWKGTSTFFDAAALLPADVLAVVIGGKPAQLEALVARYPNVRFLGYRPYRELADNQAAADLLIVPNSGRHNISARDTSPLKLFTYMASGIPIIASDLPSLREVLSEKTAFFFTPDDAQDCARGIMEALQDAEGGKRRAQAAHELVQGYTWVARAEKILASDTMQV